jgi:2-amino-4-hydroxy-6-hydroxymethyldihydropteridine diphosphokinase
VSRAVLCLGANLGDRLAALQGGVAALAEYMDVDAVSPVYETAPVGVDPQPDFLNIVVLVTTDLAPADLVEYGLDVERRMGRRPGPRGAARPLDVDVIAYDDVVSDDPSATVPHPRAYQRAFVLRPWLDVDPDATLVGHGRVDALLDDAVGEIGRTDFVVEPPA